MDMKILYEGRQVDQSREVEFVCARCGCIWRQPEWGVYARQCGAEIVYRSICPTCGLPVEGGAKK